MWPFEVLGGIFWGFLNFQEIKLFEAQGEFRKESLMLGYASTLPTDTLHLRMRSEPHRWTSSQRRHQPDHWRSRKAEFRFKIYAIESGRIDRKYTQRRFKFSSLLYAQQSRMTDELAGARCTRLINKRFFELGEERFEKTWQNLVSWLRVGN